MENWQFWMILFAVVTSLFYGWKAPEIFQVNRAAWPWSQYLHQFWLNFAGAFTGWVVVWLLWRKFGAEKPPEFGAWDFIGVLVALVGVTGYLPMAAVGLAYGVAGAEVALVSVVRDWIIEKLKADAGKGTPPSA